MKDYSFRNNRIGITEDDRSEAREIIERHFPEISPNNVYRVTVTKDNGHAIVKVYQYAQHHETGRKYIDETTRDVAVLPIIVKGFPDSGLFSP